MQVYNAMSSNHESDTVLGGLKRGAVEFILRPTETEDLQTFGRHTTPKTPGSASSVVASKKRAYGKAPMWTENAGEKRTEWKRKMPMKLREVGSSSGSKKSKKKTKMVWSTWLHTLFIIAINEIGFENCVPKKILEFMGVPGLTREHVASHLQKYRIFLRRGILMKELAAKQSMMSLAKKIRFRSSFALDNLYFGRYREEYVQRYTAKQRQRAEKLKADEKFRTRSQYGASQLSLNDIRSPPRSSFGSSRLYNTRNTRDMASNFMANVGVNGLNSYMPQANEMKRDANKCKGKNVILGIKDLQFFSRDPVKFNEWKESHCGDKNDESRGASYDAGFVSDQIGGSNFFLGESSSARMGGGYVPSHVQPVPPAVPLQPVMQQSREFDYSIFDQTTFSQLQPAPAVPGSLYNKSLSKAPLIQNPISTDFFRPGLDSNPVFSYTPFGIGGDDVYFSDNGNQQSYFVNPTPMQQNRHVQNDVPESSNRLGIIHDYPVFTNNDLMTPMQQTRQVQYDVLESSNRLGIIHDNPAFSDDDFMMPILDTPLDDLFMHHMLEESFNQLGVGVGSKGKEVVVNAQETAVGTNEGTMPFSVQAQGYQQQVMNDQARNSWDDEGFLAWLDQAGDDEMGDHLMFDIDAFDFDDGN